MPRRALFCLFIAALTGVPIALAGCGGSSESDPVQTVSIDTSAQRSFEQVAQALASEHGAPGEHEPLRYVLVGDGATEDLVNLLRARGFADVSMGGR